MISLISSGKHFSYYRLRPEEYLHTRILAEEEIEIHLIADNSVSNLRDCNAGILTTKIVAAPRDLFNTFNWPGPPKMKLEKIRIIANIYQAKDLIPSDTDGLGDPLVLLYHLGSVVKTSVFPRTLNPSWN